MHALHPSHAQLAAKCLLCQFAFQLQLCQVVTMSMKKLTPNWLAAPTGSRIRKSKTKSKRYSEVLSVCSTSWFASPAELDSDVPGQPEECSKAKG